MNFLVEAIAVLAIARPPVVYLSSILRVKLPVKFTSSAYKDIDVVMEEQKDLVDIVVKLTPLAVIKG